MGCRWDLSISFFLFSFGFFCFLRLDCLISFCGHKTTAAIPLCNGLKINQNQKHLVFCPEVRKHRLLPNCATEKFPSNMQKAAALPAVEPLVSVSWLKEQLDLKRTDIVVLDASYDSSRDCKEQHFKSHIPGAVFFDFKLARDVSSPYPNMLPPPQVFAQYCGSIGLDNNMHIVIYDNNARGLFSAPRAYWLFKAFGHDKVSLLNGGLVTWIQNGFETVADNLERPAKIFHATLKKEYVKSYDEVVHAVNGAVPEAQIMDARPPVLFQAGHIAKAKNIPYFSVLNDLPNATLKDESGLRQVFADAGIDLDRPCVSSCNSGMSACVLFFAASLLGKKPPEIAVYDGSWSEWEPRSKGHHGLVEYTTP